MKLEKFNKAVQGFITALELSTDKPKFCEDKAQSLRLAYPNLHTLKTYFSKYRKALKDSGNASLMDLFSLEIEQSEKIKKEYVNKVQLRTEKAQFVKVTTKQANQFVSICEDLAKRAKPLEVALGLLGLTGRRTVEILSTGHFKRTSSHYLLTFSGQAKKGENKEASPYEIHTLGTGKMICDGLQYVRDNLAFVDNEDVNSKTAKALQRLIEKEFEGLPIESPHDLRKLYVAIAYKLHGKGQSFRNFAAQNLGHETGESITAETYYKYKIS